MDHLLKEDVHNTAQALIFFAFGVPAFALIKVLSNFILQE